MMKFELKADTQKLSREIQSLTGENVNLCYQCRKCSVGCPAAYEMSLKPHEMMRALQLGLEGEVFQSGTIWICLTCETCNTRCPQDIDIVRVIDGLRELVMGGQVDYYNPHREIPAMHRVFLNLVERYGRIYEMGLALIMNLKMVDPFKDIDMVWPMLRKGKLKLRPHKTRGAREVRRVVSKIRKLEGES
jgi:heterodisulfide reductase subunit C